MGRLDARGLTFVEAITATMIVALLAMGLHAAGETVLGATREADTHGKAMELALSLLDEVASLPFDDPVLGTPFGPGPEPGEWSAGGNRSAFDDIDDYTVWDGTQSLQQKDGTPIDAPGYARRVAISYVTAENLIDIAAGPGPLRRITVRVTLEGGTIATVTTVRADGGRHVDG